MRATAQTSSAIFSRSSSRYIGRPLWSGIFVAGSIPIAWYSVASIIRGVIALPLASAPRVAGPDRLAHPQPAARHDGDARLRPVLAARSAPGDARVAPHLAGHEDRHVVVQAALAQVGDRRARGAIDHGMPAMHAS
jgi:hypothetical protein